MGPSAGTGIGACPAPAAHLARGGNLLTTPRLTLPARPRLLASNLASYIANSVSRCPDPATAATARSLPLTLPGLEPLDGRLPLSSPCPCQGTNLPFWAADPSWTGCSNGVPSGANIGKNNPSPVPSSNHLPSADTSPSSSSPRFAGFSPEARSSRFGEQRKPTPLANITKKRGIQTRVNHSQPQARALYGEARSSGGAGSE